jgi:syntaxin 7
MNISSVAVDTGAASEELTTAAEYQRKAGRRAACLLLVGVFVVAIVLLAVSLYILNFTDLMIHD